MKRTLIYRISIPGGAMCLATTQGIQKLRAKYTATHGYPVHRSSQKESQTAQALSTKP